MDNLLGILQAAALALIAVGYRWQHGQVAWRSQVFVAIASIIVIVNAYQLAAFINARIHSTVEWDFLNFWLAGTIAVKGMPLYEASSYLLQTLPFYPSREFFEEVILVGTMYTPPGVLLFLPLGWFDYLDAFKLWTIAQGAVLAVTLLLMRAEFYDAAGWREQLATGVCILGFATLFPLVKSTLYYGQLNIVMACLFMLVWRMRGSAIAGVWVGLGFCIKPYFGIFALWFVMNRRFGALIAMMGSVIAAVAFAGLVLGFDQVQAYIVDNPVSKAPPHLYTQAVNESLLAELRRFNGELSWEGTAVIYWPYLASAAALTLLTMASVVYAQDERWSLCACLALGLLLAPQSLYHYAAVLLPVLVFLAATDRYQWWGVVTAGGLGVLAAFSGYVVFLSLLVWLIAASNPLWETKLVSNEPQRAPS